jgi:hypothetical protein
MGYWCWITRDIWIAITFKNKIGLAIRHRVVLLAKEKDALDWIVEAFTGSVEVMGEITQRRQMLTLYPTALRNDKDYGNFYPKAIKLISLNTYIGSAGLKKKQATVHISYRLGTKEMEYAFVGQVLGRSNGEIYFDGPGMGIDADGDVYNVTCVYQTFEDAIMRIRGLIDAGRAGRLIIPADVGLRTYNFLVEHGFSKEGTHRPDSESEIAYMMLG